MKMVVVRKSYLYQKMYNQGDLRKGPLHTPLERGLTGKGGGVQNYLFVEKAKSPVALYGLRDVLG